MIGLPRGTNPKQKRARGGSFLLTPRAFQDTNLPQNLANLDHAMSVPAGSIAA